MTMLIPSAIILSKGLEKIESYQDYLLARDTIAYNRKHKYHDLWMFDEGGDKRWSWRQMKRIKSRRQIVWEKYTMWKTIYERENERINWYDRYEMEQEDKLNKIDNASAE